MVGDLFFWSFCCLRLWKRDKKVRLFTGRLTGWYTVIHQPAGREGGREAKEAGWGGLPVASAETRSIFYLFHFKSDAKAWYCTPLCFVCHFKTRSEYCVVITELSPFSLCGAPDFFSFFHVMKNWWAMAHMLYLGSILPQIKVGCKVRECMCAHIHRWTTVVMSNNCVTLLCYFYLPAACRPRCKP